MLRSSGFALVRSTLAVGVLVSACIAPAVATAQPAASSATKPSSRVQSSEVARALLEAAARAKAVGRYAFAIHALSEARRLPLSDEQLSRVAELQRGIPEEHTTADAVSRRSAVSRVSVLSPALGATARVDGGASQKLPLFLEVAAGKHTIVVSAPGWLDESREIVVSEGAVYPLEVELDPQPAKLVIEAAAGAAIHVDGKLVGTAPLAKPIDVNPGEHFVSATRTGFLPHARTVRVERGKTSRMSIDLESTSQRKVAFVLVGTGGAGIATGIALGIASVIHHRTARDIERSNDGRELSAEQTQTRDDAIAARDDLRVGSGIAAGVGLAAFLAGGALLVFDSPRRPTPPTTGRTVVRPGIGGSTLTLTF